MNRGIQHHLLSNRFANATVAIVAVWLIVILSLHNISYIYLNQALALGNASAEIGHAETFLNMSERASFGIYGRSNKKASLTIDLLNGSSSINSFENLGNFNFSSVDFLYWANVATQMGDHHLANDLLNVASVTPHEDGRVWLALSQNYILLGNLDAALFASQQAWQIDSIEYTKNYVSVLLASQKQTDAIAILSEMLSQEFQHRDRFWMYETLGRLYVENQQLEEAKSLYLLAIEEIPDSPIFYIRLGWVHFESDGHVQLAQAFFNDASNTSNPAPAYYALGRLNALEEKYDDAEQWFAKAIDADPTIRNWHVTRGLVAMQFKEYEHAIIVWHEMLTHFPNDIFAELKLSEAYIFDQSYPEAELILENILEEDPANEEAKQLIQEIEGVLE